MWATKGRQMRWIFTAVYASPHQQEREAFWADIQQFGIGVPGYLWGILVTLST